MKNEKVLSFGIMCNSTSFSAWEAESIKKILETDCAKPKLLIINNNKQTFKQKLNKLLKIKHLLFNFYNHVIVNPTSRANKVVDVSKELKNVKTIRCDVIKKGKFSEYFTEEDIRKIRDEKLDFIIRFSFNIIRGEILETAKYGVWSYHHGDEEKYRGSPPCFWEIYKKDPISGVILQKLTDKLDGGIILQKGLFQTINYSYGKNRDRVMFGGSELAAKICKDIVNNNEDCFKSEPSKSEVEILKRPTNIQMIKFLIKILNNKLKKIHKFLFVHEQWNIGIVNSPIEKFLDKGFKPEIKWLNEKSFKADPFGIKIKDKLYITFESFDFNKNKGNISLMEIKDKTTEEEIIKSQFHISYPYLIKYKNNIYCIPESHQAGGVSLFKAKEFPDNWINVKILIKEPVVDPTVIYYHNLWWLFGTKPDESHHTKLYIWYSKDLLGPWFEHTGNPVKTNIKSSRPAGTPFEYKGNIYRPAQDCSEDYGKKVTINKILELTPNKFKEIEENIVNPDDKSKFKDGIHTISKINNITIVDGKENKFIIKMFIHRIRNIIKYLK